VPAVLLSRSNGESQTLREGGGAISIAITQFSLCGYQQVWDQASVGIQYSFLFC